MQEKADEIAIGIEVVRQILKPKAIIVAIENNKPKAIELFEEKTRNNPNVEIVPLAKKYPQGGEKQLVDAVIRRQVPAPPAIPVNVGAIVQNVGTAFAVYQAVMKNKPLFERYTTVTGKKLAKPSNFLVRMGTPMIDLINECGGMPEGDLPVVTINDEKKWIFSYEGEEIELGSALPVDGKDGLALVMSIDDEGYWCYQIGDGEKQRVPGAYNVADVSKIHPSIFEEVIVSSGNPDVLQFKLYDSDDYINVALLGGMDMIFSEQNPTITEGGNKTLTATLTEVDKVVISPTPLEVELTDAQTDNLTIKAPATVRAGEYTVYFEIYNTDGYRLVKPLHVTVTA